MNELISLIKRELNTNLPLEPNTPLISSGLIDSFRVAGLLVALESHYQLRIDPSEVGADNFDSPEQILQVIQAHQ